VLPGPWKRHQARGQLYDPFCQVRRSFCRPRELSTPMAQCLATGAARAAAQMSQPGRQLPQALLDEAQDAVASLYLLLQVWLGSS